MEQTTSSYQSSMFSGILRQIAASAASDNQQQQQQQWSRVSQVSQRVVMKRCDYDRKVDNLETKIRWIKEIKKWTMEGGEERQPSATEATPASGERKRSRKRGDVVAA